MDKVIQSKFAERSKGNDIRVRVIAMIAEGHSYSDINILTGVDIDRIREIADQYFNCE